jgi:CRP-like cAMP-binding protein
MERRLPLVPPGPLASSKLLSLLPPSEYAGLAARLVPVSLETKRVLFEPGEAISHVYFPIDAMISLVAVFDDGTAIEIATIGNEGLAGLPAFLETGSLPFQGICQVGGDALRIRADDLKDFFGEGARLPSLLQRYTQALLVQIGQSSACNRIHSMEERCARWLLQTHDRVGDDEFNLTHEFLAEMLGVRRASVSVAAGELQRTGLIQYNRGRVTIQNRPGLEAAACECYVVITREYERLLGSQAFPSQD